MSDHEELLNEAQGAREGMTRKEMWDWIFDHVFVMNKEFGILTGKVDVLTKVVFGCLVVLVLFIIQRTLGG